MIPTCVGLNPLVAVVFIYKIIKNPFEQELAYLSEDKLTFVHTLRSTYNL